MTETVNWKEDLYGRAKEFLFAPCIEVNSYEFAYNRNESGRYNYVGKDSIPESAVVVHQNIENPTFRARDGLLYPAISVQQPEITQVKVKKECVSDLSLPKDTLLMRFGFRTKAVNKHSDELVMETNLLVYRDSLVLAKRIVNWSGVKYDCPSMDWSETLEFFNKSITKENLEPNIAGFKNFRTSYFTYPEPLILFTETREGEEARSYSSSAYDFPLKDIYDFISEVISKNCKLELSSEKTQASLNSNVKVETLRPKVKTRKPALKSDQTLESKYFSVSSSDMHTGLG